MWQCMTMPLHRWFLFFPKMDTHVVILIYLAQFSQQNILLFLIFVSDDAEIENILPMEMKMCKLRKTIIYILLISAFQTVIVYLWSSGSLPKNDVIIRLFKSSRRSFIGHLLFGIGKPDNDVIAGDTSSKMSAEETYNIWFNVDMENVPKQFKPVLTVDDVYTCIALLQTFVSALEASNITYFMYFGTLLGSYRHHGFIPWDDDIDIVVDYRQKMLLTSVLTKIPEYKLMPGPDVWLLKFFSTKNGSDIPDKRWRWRWPFIDIFFFKQDENSVWVTFPGQNNLWDNHIVFPLIRRPFLNMHLYAPHHTYFILNQTFDINNCIDTGYTI